MPNQLLGYIDCPHCGKEVALRESKKVKAYYTCDDCGQFFARTPGADEALRAKARPNRKEEKTDVRQEGQGDGEEPKPKKSGWADGW